MNCIRADDGNIAVLPTRFQSPLQSAGICWNKVPADIHGLRHTLDFKQALKGHLFAQYELIVHFPNALAVGGLRLLTAKA